MNSIKNSLINFIIYINSINYHIIIYHINFINYIIIYLINFIIYYIIIYLINFIINFKLSNSILYYKDLYL